MNCYLKKIKLIFSMLTVNFLMIICFHIIFSAPLYALSAADNRNSEIKKPPLYSHKRLDSILKLKIPKKVHPKKIHNLKYYPYLLHKKIYEYVNDNESLQIILPEVSDEDIKFKSEIHENFPETHKTRSLKRTVICYSILSLCIVAILLIIAYNIKIPINYGLHFSAKYNLKKLKGNNKIKP